MVVRRLIPDISVFMKFLDASMISCNTGNLCKRHQVFTEYTDRTFAIIVIPVLHYCHKQTNVHRIYPAIVTNCDKKILYFRGQIHEYII